MVSSCFKSQTVWDFNQLELRYRGKNAELSSRTRPAARVRGKDAAGREKDAQVREKDAQVREKARRDARQNARQIARQFAR